jgi:hypothetical protein
VLGRRRAHCELPELELVPGLDLVHAREPGAAQQLAEALRRDDGQGSVEASERAPVEVVEVAVREEDRVHLPGINVRFPAKVPDSPPQHRVGDEPRAVDVDHDGAVP